MSSSTSLFLFRLFLLQVVCTMLLAYPLNSKAQSRGQGHGHGHGQGQGQQQPPMPPMPGQPDVIQPIPVPVPGSAGPIPQPLPLPMPGQVGQGCDGFPDSESFVLSQNVLGGARINLTQMLSSFRGRPQGLQALQSVILDVSVSNSARVELLVNGFSSGIVRQLSYLDNFVELDLIGGRNIIGQDIRSLELLVSGSVFLGNVEIVKSDACGMQVPRIIRAQLNISTATGRVAYSLASLLANQLPLGRMGMQRRVVALTIQAFSSLGRGDIALVAPGFGPLGRITLDQFQRVQRINLMQPVDINSLQLRLIGALTLQSITVELE